MQVVCDTRWPSEVSSAQSLPWHPSSTGPGLLRSTCWPVGLQGIRLQISYFERVRWLWRCRSFKCLFHRPRCRVAYRGNSRRQSRPAQGLWDRPLLGRGVGCFFESSSSFHNSFAVEWISSFQRLWQRPAPASRSALPLDPPVQPRCESRRQRGQPNLSFVSTRRIRIVLYKPCEIVRVGSR